MHRKSLEPTSRSVEYPFSPFWIAITITYVNRLVDLRNMCSVWTRLFTYLFIYLFIYLFNPFWSSVKLCPTLNLTFQANVTLTHHCRILQLREKFNLSPVLATYLN